MKYLERVWDDVQRIRDAKPLVHNITNYVVMEFSANALLALGASPVMAHAPEEVEDMVAIASALVINIGTLSTSWISAMHKAAAMANNRSIPVVFDPVGCGATPFRTATATDLVEKHQCAVIRGNASEISSLAGTACAATRGVDSSMGVEESSSSATRLSHHYKTVAVVSGPVDLVTSAAGTCRISNGHAMMSRVTGMGCTATALIGAFCAVNKQYRDAADHAMTVMGIVGERAAERSSGPGSFKVAFLDELYALDKDAIEEKLNLEPTVCVE